MPRKTVDVDRSQQFDLLGETPASEQSEKLVVGASGRKFKAPDRREIYLGMTRLDHYLEQAGLTAPLTIATLLDDQDWREFESRYADTGRAPYAPRAMMGIPAFSLQDRNIKFSTPPPPPRPKTTPTGIKIPPRSPSPPTGYPWEWS